jgi:pheromone shutdown-related protein TraB
MQFPGREILLIGTAHVSRESIAEVDRVIRESRPAMVCVELDAGRFAAISQQDAWEKLDLVKAFREGKGFLLMANLALASFQRRMGMELGVKPGEEMKTAVDTAQELGIPYALCDREVQLTLRRAWSRCGLWSKCKLLAALVSSAFSREKLNPQEIEELKSRNELDGMMRELAQYLPRVKETLIDERDRYLGVKIWTAGPGLEASPVPEKKVVAAVVGAGHLKGIKAHIEAIAQGREDTDITELDTIPARSAAAKLVPWLLPVFLGILIALGFFISGAGVSLTMLAKWLLLNGSLAALGALIALGHPLTILASFFGAPVGTLSPLISVGFFSGVVEASLRRPRILDTQTLFDDILSIKGIYRNRISKALLVFLLSSLGGAIGNFISIPALAGLLLP